MLPAGRRGRYFGFVRARACGGWAAFGLAAVLTAAAVAYADQGTRAVGQRAEYDDSTESTTKASSSARSAQDKPPLFTVAPRIGLSSVNVAPLQSLLADQTGRSLVLSYGIELGYRSPSGWRFGLAGARQSFGDSSSDYEATFTGNYSVSTYWVSALVGYDVFSFSAKSAVAGQSSPSLVTLGPLLEGGMTIGTQIQGANAYGENIQSASTSIPFVSAALALGMWKRGLPVGASLRLGYRYFPALVFPGGSTQVSLSAPFLDFTMPISL